MTITYAPSKAFVPPSESSLIETAMTFMKENYPRKKFWALKKSGELEELARLKASACKDYAENLIKTGTFANQAWNMAIKQEILGSESD